MPNIANINKVNDLKKTLSEAKSIVMADYQGLTHKQLEALRKDIKPIGGEFEVVKNTLLAKTLEQMKVDGLKKEDFFGPIAVVIATEDEISALQKFSQFIKKQGVGQIKFGVLNNKVLSQDEVLKLSMLPSVLILKGQVVSAIASPMTGMLSVLNGNLRKLVIALSEIQKKKAN